MELMPMIIFIYVGNYSNLCDQYAFEDVILLCCLDCFVRNVQISFRIQLFHGHNLKLALMLFGIRVVLFRIVQHNLI